MNALALLALAAGAGAGAGAAAGAADQIVVIEARTPGGEAPVDLGQSLASALGGLPPAEAAAALSQALPTVTTSGRSEPVIEAERLVQKGRDAYLDGRFAEAATQLSQAREVLKKAIESFDEERQAAETLFKAHMYLAFTLRARGGDFVREATEALKEGIRTFPNLDPSVAEYGPENVRFYREIKKQMEQAPTGRLRVQTTGEQANVYLNGRLVGVTPLEMRRLYVGRYRLHLRQGSETSRVRSIEVASGDNEVQIDLSLDHALLTSPTAALTYAADGARRAQHAGHAQALAKLTGARAALVYWVVGERAELTWAPAEGRARHASAQVAEAPHAAVALRDGTAGSVAGGPEEPSRHRLWTYVAGGVAVAALVTAIGIGVSVSSDIDDLNRKYPSGTITDPKDLNRLDSAKSNATLSDVMYGVAAAAAVGSVVLFFYEGRPSPSPGEREAALVPVLGPSYAGASWRLRF